jgi:queuine tRNA-ribosyltransferase
LDFYLDFGSDVIEGKRPLGRDMFLEENAEAVEPLVEGCLCFTCTKHHRAYIHHLLKCHEMTAWVLLQMYLSVENTNDSHNFHILDLFFKDIRRAIEMDTLPVIAERFDKMYSTHEIIEAGTRGPRVRGHHTTLRREQKKRKLPMAQNKGVVGKETSVLSGGEVIEQEGKRKHWRTLEGDDNVEIMKDNKMEILDEEDNVEGELLTDGEVEIGEENVENQFKE